MLFENVDVLPQNRICTPGDCNSSRNGDHTHSTGMVQRSGNHLLHELIASFVFLVVIPVAAYPVSFAIPKLRKGGRI